MLYQNYSLIICFLRILLKLPFWNSQWVVADFIWAPKWNNVLQNLFHSALKTWNASSITDLHSFLMKKRCFLIYFRNKDSEHSNIGRKRPPQRVEQSLHWQDSSGILRKGRLKRNHVFIRMLEFSSFKSQVINRLWNKYNGLWLVYYD